MAGPRPLADPEPIVYLGAAVLVGSWLIAGVAAFVIGSAL